MTSSVRPIVLLFTATLLAGCSDAFDPFVASDQTFALFGFLDARRDTQFVRVQPIAEQADTPAAVEARVTSTDLVTRERLVWQDSLIVLDDDDVGTAFFAPFRPVAGRVYRLEAMRLTDGAVSTADVALPTQPPLQVAPPDVISTIVAQLLTIENDRPPSAVVVTYTVRPVGDEEPVRVEVPYDAVERETGFGVAVSLSRDAGVILSGVEKGTEVELLDLEIAYDLVNEPPVLVEGGAGQIGVAAAFTNGWRLDAEFVELIGFVDAQSE